MIVETRVCDIYGQSKDVANYEVIVRLKDLAGDRDEGPAILAKDIDLCPKALERLLGFIRRGIAPPRSADDDTEGTDE